MSQIEFRQVSKRFPSRQSADPPNVVEGINFKIASGEIVSIIGPSGCGKSTLLNMGSGLYLPTSGEVLIDDERVTRPLKRCAFMLQKDLLMPWRTICDNIALGLEIDGVSRLERRERAETLLKRFHLESFGGHYPYQLSGGMRQRAALARTLATNPDILLLDEPFSALDAQTKMVLQEDLAETLYEEKKTALLITHDLVEAIALSDRLLVMSQRPGRLIEEIVVDLPQRNCPMERRQERGVADYVRRLMSLLQIGRDIH